MVALRTLTYLLALSAIIVLMGSLFFQINTGLIGASYLILSPLIIFGSFHLYVSYLLNNPSYLINEKMRSDLLNRFDFESLEIIYSLKSKPDLRSFLLKCQEHKIIQVIFLRLGINNSFLEEVISNDPIDENSQNKLVEAMVDQSIKQTHALVNVFDLLNVVLTHPQFQKLLIGLNIEEQIVNNLVDYYQSQYIERNKMKNFWLVENRIKTGGFARSWAISYTNILDAYTEEILPENIRYLSLRPIFSRDKLIKEMVTDLNKSQGRNVLLVGESGVGKKEIFYHLAQEVLTSKTKTSLDKYQIRILDVQHLLSSAKDIQELQRIVEAIYFDLVHSGNVILFIDQINLLLSPIGETGSVNLGNLLEGYLKNSKMKVIGTITNQDYILDIKSNPLLSEPFSIIKVNSPDDSELEKIILSKLPFIENRYQVFFMIDAIQNTIKTARRYLKDKTSPQRETDLLEETASKCQANSQVLIQAEDIDKTVESILGVPIEIGQEDTQSLLNLETLLHRRVIGQNQAIKAVCDSLIRARAGVASSIKPVGTFLFLGPTGVGKTETAKALTEVYYHNIKNLIRLDMTEYADQFALEKLLGSNPTTQPGTLTVAVQDHPSSIVLLDEIEKASDQIKNVMLQLIDEGRLTTNYGKVLDFTNCIIIATSNAGSELIKEKAQSGSLTAGFQKQLLDYLIKENIFRVEFLNRFDGVIVYLPLTQAEILEVVRLRLKSLSSQLQTDKGITLLVSDDVVKKLAQKGYDPVYGARAIDRVIKDDLETVVARKILSDKIKAGGTLEIGQI